MPSFHRKRSRVLLTTPRRRQSGARTCSCQSAEHYSHSDSNSATEVSVKRSKSQIVLEGEDYGWFNEDVESTNTDETRALAVLSQWNHGISSKVNKCAGTQYSSTLLEQNLPGYNVAKKRFEDTPLLGECSTVAIALTSLRIVKDLNGFERAEYQVASVFGTKVVSSWVRFSLVKKWAEKTVSYRYPRTRSASYRYPRTRAAWALLKAHKKWYRCLEPSFLEERALLLDHFFCKFLFECEDPVAILSMIVLCTACGMQKNGSKTHLSNASGFLASSEDVSALDIQSPSS